MKEYISKYSTYIQNYCNVNLMLYHLIHCKLIDIQISFQIINFLKSFFFFYILSWTQNYLSITCPSNLSNCASNFIVNIRYQNLTHRLKKKNKSSNRYKGIKCFLAYYLIFKCNGFSLWSLCTDFALCVVFTSSHQLSLKYKLTFRITSSCAWNFFFSFMFLVLSIFTFLPLLSVSDSHFLFILKRNVFDGKG